MKKKVMKISLTHWTVILLFCLLVLPSSIDWLYKISGQYPQGINQVWLEMKVLVITLVLLSFPLYLLLTRIHLKETQSYDTRRNVAELIDHAADIILITRPNGQIINANRKACQMLGYSIEQLKSMSNMDLDVECTLYRTPKMHQQLYSGKTVTFESSYCTANGERLPVENHVSVAGWMEDTHYLEIARDITQRRKVEQELHASKEALERVRNKLETRMQERTEKLVQEVQKRELTEKRIYEIRLLLENLVNSMPSVIISLDDKLKVTQWNLEAEKIFGILEGAALGQVIVQLLPQFKPIIFRLMRNSDNGQLALNESINIELDNIKRQFNVMLYPLSQAAGTNSPGVVIRLDDITEKAHFDEMLVQTEKMLSLGGLAAGMAHEINNPLGAILQSTQNIRRRLSPTFERNLQISKSMDLEFDKVVTYLKQQKIYDALTAIKEAGERAATIVSDMLSFARPSHGESTQVDVVEVLESSIRLAEKDYNQQRQFDFRNIHVEKNFAENLPKINAQKNQLSQVLLNLLVNAAQALATQKDNPRPTIWVSAAVGNYNLRIDIKDNGPGMNEQTRKRVFEPFFTTKNEGKGTGLGLSVSYFIVSEQLGGNLRVESEVGRGTCFTIQIPLKRPSQNTPKQDPGDEQIQLPFDGV